MDSDPMKFDWSSFLEDGAIEYFSTLNEDTVMVDSPTGWSAAMGFQLQDSSGAGSESQSREGILLSSMKSKNELANSREAETIDPSLLSKFPHDACQLGPEVAIRSSLKAAEEPLNTQHRAAGIPEHQIQIPDTPRNLIHETQSPLPVGAGTPTRRSRSNLQKPAVAILKDWLQEHQNNPYPSEEDKLDLAARCEVETKQISNWFMNARKRILKTSYDSSASLTDTENSMPSTPARGRSPQRVPAVGRSSSAESQSSAYPHSDCYTRGSHES